MKASIQYQGYRIVGFSDDELDKAAKAVLSFMVSPLMGAPSFIARLIPIYFLDHELLFYQINRLIKIGYVYLVITDNLRAN